MNFDLISTTVEHKDVIKNLMQFYIYDFSEFLKWDVGPDGLFQEHPDLENYWMEDDHRFTYLIKRDQKCAGFALVRFIEKPERSYFSIAEFFILKKYRREGVGKAVAREIFDRHKGQWEVFQVNSNKPAQLFWTNVIDEYTHGRFTDRFENGRRIQNFEN